MNEQQLLTRAQVARLLNVSPTTVWRLTNAKVLTAYRVGKVWRYKASDIEAYLSGGSNQ